LLRSANRCRESILVAVMMSRSRNITPYQGSRGARGAAKVNRSDTAKVD
jgi:hypothetical protein